MTHSPHSRMVTGTALLGVVVVLIASYLVMKSFPTGDDRTVRKELPNRSCVMLDQLTPVGWVTYRDENVCLSFVYPSSFGTPTHTATTVGFQRFDVNDLSSYLTFELSEIHEDCLRLPFIAGGECVGRAAIQESWEPMEGATLETYIFAPVHGQCDAGMACTAMVAAIFADERWFSVSAYVAQSAWDSSGNKNLMAVIQSIDAR